MKVVINRSFGGFSLSKEAQDYLGITPKEYARDDRMKCKRADEKLISCIEELGNKANGAYASLEIVEIPDDVDFYIDDYDGMETIHEKHRMWP